MNGLAMNPQQEIASWGGEAELIDNPREGVRQGDIIRWETPTSPWEVYAIVVTADCDIALGKHAEIVSYIPVLSLADYWRLFTVPKKIDKYAVEKFIPGARERIRKLQRSYRPDFPQEMSDQAIANLIQSSLPGEVVEQFRVPASECSAVTEMLTAFKSVMQIPKDDGLMGLVNLLATLRAINGGNASNKNSHAVLDELAKEIKDLPGDAFFIGCIESGRADGFVAYLRFVRELHTEAIALQSSDLKKTTTKVRRIARLRSPFIYRLTQQLGNVFADIGLPGEYEEKRSSIANDIKKSLSATI